MSHKVIIPEDTHGLPLGVSLELETTNEGVTHVTILARLHVNSRRAVPHCYSAESWPTSRIMSDPTLWKYINSYK